MTVCCLEKIGHQNLSIPKIQKLRKDLPVCLYQMWDVIKLLDVNPMYTMAIFIASGLLRKKFLKILIDKEIR